MYKSLRKTLIIILILLSVSASYSYDPVSYTKTDWRVLYWGNELIWIHYESFESLSFSYAKDKTNVLYNWKKISWVESTWISLIEEFPDYFSYQWVVRKWHDKLFNLAWLSTPALDISRKWSLLIVDWEIYHNLANLWYEKNFSDNISNQDKDNLIIDENNYWDNYIMKDWIAFYQAQYRPDMWINILKVTFNQSITKVIDTYIKENISLKVTKNELKNLMYTKAQENSDHRKRSDVIKWAIFEHILDNLDLYYENS